MEANVFVAKIKASGSETDLINLDKVFTEYKDILTKLSAKDKGPFSLNVLCILCRNIEKVPSWRTKIDNKALLTLSIDCVRETRCLTSSDKVKALACVYHIHRHVVRQNAPVPPELILKLSYMPFEENLLTDYAKTYWNIIADRIAYIDKLKTKVSVTKLRPKLIEDIVKVVKIYPTVQFCQTILTFLFKKLHYLFNDNSTDLRTVYEDIFEEISQKPDLKLSKKLTDKEIMEIYVKLNDCLYIVAEICSKTKSNGQVLNKCVQTCIAIVGHCPDLLHCLQTVYLNGFCSIFAAETNVSYVENLLENLSMTFETTEKLGYTKAMTATYTYVTQLLRLFIENTSSDKLTDDIKTALLITMQFLFKKLENCQQILKCENCNVKSGLHDALRLSFLSKNFISDGNNSKLLPQYFKVVLTQYEILNKLCAMGCVNYEKCYKKLQSDIHNTAISLNKLHNFEFSIKLFEIYLKNEIIHFKTESDLKNICRALYNKSICELDAKNYENALSDAFLSLVFAYPEGLSTEKYMSLVMDIKGKVLKTKDEELSEENSIEEIQMMTVLDVCADAVENMKYGNLKPFFCNLKFSELLHHEFSMYVKLWPSLAPVAGVWKTLRDLTQHEVPWLNAKDEAIEDTLIDIIVRTPSAVRTIHHEVFADVLRELVADSHHKPAITSDQRIIQAILLLLKTEFDLYDASQKYGWKFTEQNTDPDQYQAYRTLSQEHDATESAVRAVQILTDVSKELDTVENVSLLDEALKITQVLAMLLLHLYRTLEGLQLTYICCVLAEYIGDKQSYLHNASTIIYHANKQTDELTNIITTASKYCQQIIQKNTQDMDTALVFLSDCAIFYHKIGSYGMSAKLMQVVQAKILNAFENNPEINLDLAIGHLLEAEALVSLSSERGPSALSAIIGAHRHYLTITNCESKYTWRRLRALCLKLLISYSGTHSAAFARALLCWRRARSAAASTLAAAGAVAQGALFALICNTSRADDAQVKIDNRLKYILGLQTATDQPISLQTEARKPHYPQKQELETMLEHMTLKTQLSPTLHPQTAKFNLPEFLTHKNCKCFACSNKFAAILTCLVYGLEASMYFRAKEFDLAKNFFEGALECCFFTEKLIKNKNTGSYENFLVDLVDRRLLEEFLKVKIEVMIEAALFELAQKDFKATDEYIIRIHEILQDNDNISPYLKNEVNNLIIASAVLRKTDNKEDIDTLKVEFDNLKLSPAKNIDPPKTPEAKPEKPPKISKIKLKDEEIPNTKRKVIKLNLDEASEEKEPTVRRSKRTEFKIPVPVMVKPVLESITPTPKRKKPEILVSQPSTDESIDFATPKPKLNNTEFFTPIDTPSEQFFTPMSSIKTYTKKSLRHGIVKNLESEFATPKPVKKEDFADETVNLKLDTKKTLKKENLESKISEHDNVTVNKENANETKPRSKIKAETGSLKTLKDKRSLKRATSPGKLENSSKSTTSFSKTTTNSATRTRRLPVRFSVDKDDSKNDK